MKKNKTLHTARKGEAGAKLETSDVWEEEMLSV